MVRTKTTLVLAFLILCIGTKAQNTDIRNVIEHGLNRSLKQSLIMAKSLESEGGTLPRTYEKERLRRCNYKNWVSGFFPGVLWYLFERLYTERIDSAKTMKWTHDLGFIINCSYGNGFRLTGTPDYLAVMEEGAQSLIMRYN